VILAGMFRFTAREYFEAEPESREAVQVSFDTPPSVAATPAPAAPAAPEAAPTPPPAEPPTAPGTPPTT
jgi:hypothetical protein